ncbi:multiple epidermal growth factor-like domains protein 8 [Zonotrichia leucophrys gambelii]|uniref:multiple epidermal growth factor-like domains protein 8 n=1 Tax=Zonotrichia leucophrys gambelii TaxID=257770 RepID=UPI00313FE128
MERDACLRCMNNTQGPQCQQCRPGFVGSALSGGWCLPCRSFCRGRAHVCLSRAHLERHRRDPARHPLEAHLLHPWVPEGPSEAQAVCVNCQDNSVGDRCDTCRAGFFMLDGTCTRCHLQRARRHLQRAGRHRVPVPEQHRERRLPRAQRLLPAPGIPAGGASGGCGNRP